MPLGGPPLRYFPLFFDLRRQKVLVVGGGEVALRKLDLLERAGATVTLVAPRAEMEIERRADARRITLLRREFLPDDLEDARLVIAATSRRAINRWIANLCEARAIAVNVVDDRAASRVIVPALIDRDPVLIAVSSGGDSPVLSRRLRERLEALISRRTGKLASWLGELRAVSRRRLRTPQARRRYFETLVDGPAARRFLQGDESGARRLAQRSLAADAATAPPAGEVTLVGAGPGDPELLTLKALRALQDADVILHDRLVPKGILDYARRDARCIAVGKSAGGGGATQAEINALLIEHARRGGRVVRLKGGDPFIFGRGGEELEALAQAGIAYSVIPGVSAANGCAAYAGIPLTHRDHAHSVCYVTGHASEGGSEPDWRALSAPKTTAVIYMGLARLARITAQLMDHGAPPTRPAAVVSRGTTPEQQVMVGTLADIAAVAQRADLDSPALLIVGDVAALHSTLAWFGDPGAADALRAAESALA
jgi:uroporphyrin-III C-methyltransferase / precorrin-2 dehydrogenase / sirohydrochlorin ferrochelatase